jgi:hypothetical protein
MIDRSAWRDNLGYCGGNRVPSPLWRFGRVSNTSITDPEAVAPRTQHYKYAGKKIESMNDPTAIEVINRRLFSQRRGRVAEIGVKMRLIRYLRYAYLPIVVPSILYFR